MSDELPVKLLRGAVLVLFAAAFIAVVLVIGISVYAGRIVTQFERKEVPPIKVNLAVSYTSVNFKSIDGTTTLRGWLFNTPSATGNIVIMVHGMGENRFQFGEDTLDIVETIIENNFSVLAFDLRNSGDSDVGIPTFGLHERDDVLGAVNYARSQKFTKIVLYGFASGANAAILASAKPKADKAVNPALTQELLDTLSNSVDALILDTPITDVSEYLAQLLADRDYSLPEFPFKYTLPLAVNLYINGDVSDADIMKCFYDFIPRHVLLLCGGMDYEASSAGILEMYEQYNALATGKISIWDDPNSGHLESFSNSKQQYLSKLTDFFNLAFPVAPAES